MCHNGAIYLDGHRAKRREEKKKKKKKKKREEARRVCVKIMAKG